MIHKATRVQEFDWPGIKNLRLEMISKNPEYFNVNNKLWADHKDQFWRNFTKTCANSSQESIFVVRDKKDLMAMAHADISDKRANFGMLYVKENYRNMGLAEALVVAREKWAKDSGAEIAVCLITEGNIYSEKLHTKLGWRRTGIKLQQNSIVENEWIKDL